MDLFRALVLLVGVASIVACKSYKEEWMQSQRQLQRAEARVSALRSEVEVRDHAIDARDRAIMERDLIIREQCIAKPQPGM